MSSSVNHSLMRFGFKWCMLESKANFKSAAGGGGSPVIGSSAADWNLHFVDSMDSFLSEGCFIVRSALLDK